MSARRVVALGVLVACLAAWPPARATADDGPPRPADPGPRVDRDEQTEQTERAAQAAQAEQADVAGFPAGAVLFAPGDTAAIAAAVASRAAVREAAVGTLFLRPAVPARPPVPTDLLFRPGSVPGGGPVRVAPDDPPGGARWASPVIGVLLVTGSALSYGARERREDAGE